MQGPRKGYAIRNAKAKKIFRHVTNRQQNAARPDLVDIVRAAGLESPDISILSDDFLAEVRDSDKKNFAIEALKKLINGEVRSQVLAKRDAVQSLLQSEKSVIEFPASKTTSKDDPPVPDHETSSN
jgi:hypothetical protein